METSTLVFLVLAAIAVVGAIGIVTASRIMHSALWMGLTFIIIAGIFLILNAEFLAAAQVLVYVGAVTTIIVFGIMLSEAGDIRGRVEQTDQEGGGWERLRRGVLPVIAAGLFTLLMVGIYLRSGWPLETPTEALADSTRAIGLQMFTDFVIPFELAAILLLVALVGAIVMATKEESK